MRDKRDKGVLLIVLAVLTGLLLSIPRSPAHDEVFYLKEALQMADSLQEGQWFGNQAVGFHGFLFKLPAALLLMITGPSVFAVTLTTILFAALALYLCYTIFLRLLESSNWALGGSLLVFSAVFFLRGLATFKRDIPALLALLLLLYLILEKKNKWLTALALMLLLDAKEGVFFAILPPLFAWFIYNAYQRSKENSSPRPWLAILSRTFVLFFPSLLFIILMLTTSLVPHNPALTKILGLNKGGLGYFINTTFAPGLTTRNPQQGGKNIAALPTAKDLGWLSNYYGKASLTGQTHAPDRYPIVKLVKPGRLSPHPSGGSQHRWRLTASRITYRKGDSAVFSLWYKPQATHPLKLHFILRYTGQANLGKIQVKKIPLEKSPEWHFLRVTISVERGGTIQPEIIWPYGRDSVLYVAGCRVEKQPLKEAPLALISQALSMDAAMNAWSKILGFLEYPLAYIGKLFYSRTFSFTSMPRFIIIPAILMSFVLFRRWRLAGLHTALALPLIFWGYLPVYLLRISTGRFLFPIVPLIMLFFIFFLKDGLGKTRFARSTLIATTLFAALGIWFETKYQLIKLALMIVFLSSLWLLYYLQRRNKAPLAKINLLKGGFVTMLALFSFIIFLGTSYTDVRQLGRFGAYGYCGEMQYIASRFPQKEVIWINHDAGLIQFFRRNKSYRPFKAGLWNWQLKDYIPKASLLEFPARFYSYSFQILNDRQFEEKLIERQISTVALLVSSIKKRSYRFPQQEWLTRMLEMPFLKLVQKTGLKNKTLYIFTFNPPR